MQHSLSGDIAAATLVARFHARWGPAGWCVAASALLPTDTPVDRNHFPIRRLGKKEPLRCKKSRQLARGETDMVENELPAAGRDARIRTVLVVEDEFLPRLAVSDYLRDCGYAVLEAANADEAMSVLNSVGSHVDVLFTDIQMSGDIDGFGLAQWVRANRPEVKVIITSGAVRVGDETAKLCSDGPLVPKPYRHADIATRIRGLFDERHQ